MSVAKGTKEEGSIERVSDISKGEEWAMEGIRIRSIKLAGEVEIKG